MAPFNIKKILKTAALCSAAVLSVACTSLENPSPTNTAEAWITTANRSSLLQKQNPITFIDKVDGVQLIQIDDSQKSQTIDGFGYTLTGGSVEVINRLPQDKRKALLDEVFGSGENGIAVSYLRISIGASDLNSNVFTYDDVAPGEQDLTLSKFSIEKDRPVIGMLKEILAINPNIKIIAVPWTAPVWMKDNGSSVGGSLKPEFYNVYARYFSKYIREMAQNGIRIEAMCVQNEPLNPKNNPSLYMTSEQQKDFIKNHLGPEFRKNGITTKIVLYDHNCDHPEYATDILKDPEAAQYIDGSAFHLYGGDVSAMGRVHEMFSAKNLYFTEQWTGSKEEFGGNLNWHVKNVIIGTMRNWSKIALEWNLANDQDYRPFTPGGCTECKGALTIHDNGAVVRNESYYIIGHASKFVPPNSVRISSSQTAALASVAFRTPQGKTVLIVQNDSSSEERFGIRFKGKTASAAIPAHSAATYVF